MPPLDNIIIGDTSLTLVPRQEQAKRVLPRDTTLQFYYSTAPLPAEYMPKPGDEYQDKVIEANKEAAKQEAARIEEERKNQVEAKLAQEKNLTATQKVFVAKQAAENSLPTININQLTNPELSPRFIEELVAQHGGVDAFIGTFQSHLPLLPQPKTQLLKLRVYQPINLTQESLQNKFALPVMIGENIRFFVLTDALIRKVCLTTETKTSVAKDKHITIQPSLDEKALGKQQKRFSELSEVAQSIKDALGLLKQKELEKELTEIDLGPNSLNIELHGLELVVTASRDWVESTSSSLTTAITQLPTIQQIQALQLSDIPPFAQGFDVVIKQLHTPFGLSKVSETSKEFQAYLIYERLLELWSQETQAQKKTELEKDIKKIGDLFRTYYPANEYVPIFQALEQIVRYMSLYTEVPFLKDIALEARKLLKQLISGEIISTPALATIAKLIDQAQNTLFSFQTKTKATASAEKAKTELIQTLGQIRQKMEEVASKQPLPHLASLQERQKNVEQDTLSKSDLIAQVYSLELALADFAFRTQKIIQASNTLEQQHTPETAFSLLLETQALGTEIQSTLEKMTVLKGKVLAFKDSSERTVINAALEKIEGTLNPIYSGQQQILANLSVSQPQIKFDTAVALIDKLVHEEIEISKRFGDKAKRLALEKQRQKLVALFISTLPANDPRRQAAEFLTKLMPYITKVLSPGWRKWTTQDNRAKLSEDLLERCLTAMKDDSSASIKAFEQLTAQLKIVKEMIAEEKPKSRVFSKPSTLLKLVKEASQSVAALDTKAQQSPEQIQDHNYQTLHNFLLNGSVFDAELINNIIEQTQKGTFNAKTLQSLLGENLPSFITNLKDYLEASLMDKTGTVNTQLRKQLAASLIEALKGAEVTHLTEQIKQDLNNIRASYFILNAFNASNTDEQASASIENLQKYLASLPEPEQRTFVTLLNHKLDTLVNSLQATTAAPLLNQLSENKFLNKYLEYLGQANLPQAFSKLDEKINQACKAKIEKLLTTKDYGSLKIHFEQGFVSKIVGKPYGIQSDMASWIESWINDPKNNTTLDNVESIYSALNPILTQQLADTNKTQLAETQLRTAQIKVAESKKTEEQVKEKALKKETPTVTPIKSTFGNKGKKKHLATITTWDDSSSSSAHLNPKQLLAQLNERKEQLNTTLEELTRKLGTQEAARKSKQAEIDKPESIRAQKQTELEQVNTQIANIEAWLKAIQASKEAELEETKASSSLKKAKIEQQDLESSSYILQRIIDHAITRKVQSIFATVTAAATAPHITQEELLALFNSAAMKTRMAAGNFPTDDLEKNLNEGMNKFLAYFIQSIEGKYWNSSNSATNLTAEQKTAFLNFLQQPFVTINGKNYPPTYNSTTLASLKTLTESFLREGSLDNLKKIAPILANSPLLASISINLDQLLNEETNKLIVLSTDKLRAAWETKAPKTNQTATLDTQQKNELTELLYQPLVIVNEKNYPTAYNPTTLASLKTLTESFLTEGSLDNLKMVADILVDPNKPVRVSPISRENLTEILNKEANKHIQFCIWANLIAQDKEKIFALIGGEPIVTLTNGEQYPSNSAAYTPETVTQLKKLVQLLLQQGNLDALKELASRLVKSPFSAQLIDIKAYSTLITNQLPTTPPPPAPGSIFNISICQDGITEELRQQNNSIAYAFAAVILLGNPQQKEEAQTAINNLLKKYVEYGAKSENETPGLLDWYQLIEDLANKIATATGNSYTKQLSQINTLKQLRLQYPGQFKGVCYLAHLLGGNIPSLKPGESDKESYKKLLSEKAQTIAAEFLENPAKNQPLLNELQTIADAMTYYGFGKPAFFADTNTIFCGLKFATTAEKSKFLINSVDLTNQLKTEALKFARKLTPTGINLKLANSSMPVLLSADERAELLKDLDEAFKKFKPVNPLAAVSSGQSVELSTLPRAPDANQELQEIYTAIKNLFEKPQLTLTQKEIDGINTAIRNYMATRELLRLVNQTDGTDEDSVQKLIATLNSETYRPLLENLVQHPTEAGNKLLGAIRSKLLTEERRKEALKRNFDRNAFSTLTSEPEQSVAGIDNILRLLQPPTDKERDLLFRTLVEQVQKALPESGDGGLLASLTNLISGRSAEIRSQIIDLFLYSDSYHVSEITALLMQACYENVHAINPSLATTSMLDFTQLTSKDRVSLDQMPLVKEIIAPIFGQTEELGLHCLLNLFKPSRADRTVMQAQRFDVEDIDENALCKIGEKYEIKMQSATPSNLTKIIVAIQSRIKEKNLSHESIKTLQDDYEKCRRALDLLNRMSMQIKLALSLASANGIEQLMNFIKQQYKPATASTTTYGDYITRLISTVLSECRVRRDGLNKRLTFLMDDVQKQGALILLPVLQNYLREIKALGGQGALDTLYEEMQKLKVNIDGKPFVDAVNDPKAKQLLDQLPPTGKIEALSTLETSLDALAQSSLPTPAIQVTNKEEIQIPLQSFFIPVRTQKTTALELQSQSPTTSKDRLEYAKQYCDQQRRVVTDSHILTHAPSINYGAPISFPLFTPLEQIIERQGSIISIESSSAQDSSKTGLLAAGIQQIQAIAKWPEQEEGLLKDLQEKLRPLCAAEGEITPRMIMELNETIAETAANLYFNQLTAVIEKGLSSGQIRELQTEINGKYKPYCDYVLLHPANEAQKKQLENAIAKVNKQVELPGIIERLPTLLHLDMAQPDFVTKLDALKKEVLAIIDFGNSYHKSILYSHLLTLCKTDNVLYCVILANLQRRRDVMKDLSQEMGKITNSDLKAHSESIDDTLLKILNATLISETISATQKIKPDETTTTAFLKGLLKEIKEKENKDKADFDAKNYHWTKGENEWYGTKEGEQGELIVYNPSCNTIQLIKFTTIDDVVRREQATYTYAAKKMMSSFFNFTQISTSTTLYNIKEYRTFKISITEHASEPMKSHFPAVCQKYEEALPECVQQRIPTIKTTHGRLLDQPFAGEGQPTTAAAPSTPSITPIKSTTPTSPEEQPSTSSVAFSVITTK